MRAESARRDGLAADGAELRRGLDALARARRDLEVERRRAQREIERLRERVDELEAEIRSMKNRHTWRFTAPLRALHDWWRRRRRARKAWLRVMAEPPHAATEAPDIRPPPESVGGAGISRGGKARPENLDASMRAESVRRDVLAADGADLRRGLEALARARRDLEVERRRARREIEGVRVRVADLEAEIRSMKKRRSWRLSAPLRALHDRWRRRAHKGRLKAVAEPPSATTEAPRSNGEPDSALQPDLDCLRARALAEFAAAAPQVTVVIPCYNYGRYVKEAVDSVLAQSYPHCDVVLVDDGSTDEETVGICRGLASDRVTLIRQENSGLSAARNAGAALTRAEFLMFLDADDRLHPDAALSMLWSLIRHPEASYVYTSQRLFGDQDVNWEPQPFNGYDLLFSNHPTVCALIRRAAFEAARGYSTGMVVGYEDWCHWLMLLSAGHFGHRLRAPLFEHRRHGRTMTHDAQTRQALLHRKLRQHAPTLYQIETLSALKARWRPAVSVVMSYFDNARFIDETLASLQRQTTLDFELVLVDDGSTDPAAIAKLAAIEAARESFGFPVTIHRRPHLGAPAARNYGALQALGEYLFMLDSDDLIQPTALEKLVLFAQVHATSAYVYSCVRHFGAIEAVACNRFDAERLKRENFLAISCLIERRVFMAIGGFDEALLDSYEDYDLWLRLLAVAYEGMLLPEPLFSYRRHAAGYRTALERQKPVDEMIRILHARHPAHYSGPEPDRSQWRLVSEPTDADEAAAETILTTLVAEAGGVRSDSFRRRITPDMFSPRAWRREGVNVLYLVPYFVCGGAERVDLDIIAGMKNRGYHVTIVACENADHVWLHLFERLSDDLFVAPNLAGDAETQDAILDYLMLSRAVDLVFIRNSAIGYRLAERWTSVTPSVRFVDLMHLHAPGFCWVRHSAIYHDLLDRRFVISEDLKTYACTTYHLPPDRFEVIYNGLDFASLPKPADHAALKREVAAEFGLDPAKPLVGFCGRLSEQKDPLRWLAVFDLASRRNPDLSGLMIGDGELEEAMKADAARRGVADKIVFAGYRDDARSLIGGCDALLMTSQYEGLPTVVLEAFAAGVPAVASDVGGTREGFGGTVSQLLPLSAPDERYAHAVLEVIERVGREPGAREACRARIENQFDLGRMQDAYCSSIERLTAGRDRAARLDAYLDRLMQRAPLG